MEFIDGHAVTRYSVRFRNRSEITEAEADVVKDGNIICWLVRARCQPPAYTPVAKDEEDRLRLSVQDVQTAVPLTGNLRDSALTYLEHGADQLYVTETGEAAFPFNEWLDKPADIQRLVLFLQERGLLGDEDPIDTVIGLLADLPLPAERRATTAGLDELPNTVDVPSAYLNDPTDMPGNEVEVVGSIYRNNPPRWMEDP